MTTDKRSSGRSGCLSSFWCCLFCVADTCRWVPVFFISAIVLWSYYAYTVELCFYAIDDVLQRGIYLAFYHISFILFAWSYGRTIFQDPGAPEKRFFLTLQQLDQLTNAETEEQEKVVLHKAASTLPVMCRQVNSDVRYCKPCTLIKPDRCHHCSICRKCVLKMDHHCPWVNNCVGFANYKFFILFLFYATVYCFYVSLTDLPYFVKYWQLHSRHDMTLSHRMQIIFLGLVAAMFILGVLSLLCYHIYLLLNNRSTIESFRLPVFANGYDEDRKRGFGIGWRNNFVQVFGPQKRYWILPLYSSVGNGNSFPIADCEPESGCLLNGSKEQIDEDEEGVFHQSNGFVRGAAATNGHSSNNYSSDLEVEFAPSEHIKEQLLNTVNGTNEQPAGFLSNDLHSLGQTRKGEFSEIAINETS